MEKYVFDLRNRKTRQILDSELVKKTFNEKRFNYCGELSTKSQKYSIYLEEDLIIGIGALGVAFVYGDSLQKINEKLLKVEEKTGIQFH